MDVTVTGQWVDADSVSASEIGVGLVRKAGEDPTGVVLLLTLELPSSGLEPIHVSAVMPPEQAAEVHKHLGHAIESVRTGKVPDLSSG
jgi:hypothetical protein